MFPNTTTNQQQQESVSILSLSDIVETALSSQSDLKAVNLDAWLSYQYEHGDEVALYRQYAQGNHRNFLTEERRKMLNLPGTGPLLGFQNNYMDIIIQSMVNRLRVTSMEADTDAGTKWASEIMKQNRFDGMQSDVHEATLGDADSYVLVTFDSKTQQVVFNHEPAWDGNDGMLVIYETATSKYPCAALKIWHVGQMVRVNAWFPDRIERWISEDGKELKPYVTDTQEPVAPLVSATGEAVGLPVIHFRNQSKIFANYGRSELSFVISLQDALNRALYSMVIASELTAFQIRYGIGFPAPAAITPGMFISISPEAPIKPDEKVDIGTIEQADLKPYLDIAQYFASQIGIVSQTPLPQFMGSDSSSGESLKEREKGLLGKIERFQVKAGNSWEDVLMTAWRMQQAYGTTKPPTVTRFDTKWKDAEIRNDAETVTSALSVQKQLGAGFNQELLRQLAPVFKWDEKRITAILADLDSSSQKQAALAGSMIPGFNNFNLPTPTNGNNPLLKPANPLAPVNNLQLSNA